LVREAHYQSERHGVDWAPRLRDLRLHLRLGGMGESSYPVRFASSRNADHPLSAPRSERMEAVSYTRRNPAINDLEMARLNSVCVAASKPERRRRLPVEQRDCCELRKGSTPGFCARARALSAAGNRGRGRLLGPPSATVEVLTAARALLVLSVRPAYANVRCCHYGATEADPKQSPTNSSSEPSIHCPNKAYCKFHL
jgi:hypothetical protein